MSNKNRSCKRTSIGGQALMEGIMMRGPVTTAMAVRNTKGEIVIEKFPTETKKRSAFLKLPLIRGVVNYIDSMVQGSKCLMRSAEISGLEEAEEEMKREKEAKKAAKEAKRVAKAAKKGINLTESPDNQVKESAVEENKIVSDESVIENSTERVSDEATVAKSGNSTQIPLQIQIKKRNVATCIFLSIITFGIYGIYWLYTLVKTTCMLQNKSNKIIKEFLCINLVPFYGLYWWYTRGVFLKQELSKFGYSTVGNGIAYLLLGILGIFGMNPVAMAILQHDYNSISDKYCLDKEGNKGTDIMGVMMPITMVISLAIAILLFFVLPTYLFTWLQIPFTFLKNDDPIIQSLIKSLFEGSFKVVILVGYMGVMLLMKDIRRTFMFHGAEHKTIFCYEAGLDLTVENIRKQKRFHPRCGTSFLILMVLVSIFVSFCIDPIFLLVNGEVPPTLIRSAIRICLIPLIVGLGYELIKIAGKHDNFITRIISAPGVWLQHITVLEPDDSMIECAIAAMKEVIPSDESDSW